MSYIHKLDKALLFEVEKAQNFLHVLGDKTPWNCIRIKPFVEVAFQYSPDFDVADEPEVAYTMVIRNGKVVVRPSNNNPIWHHKWMWVDPTYKGFDYEASKARSALWKPHVKKSELTKIGNKVYWESIKERWEQCK